MAVAEYLADKSVWSRVTKPAVRTALEPLIVSGRVATCGMVDAEMLFSARNVADHERIRAQRLALEWLPIFDECWARVADVQRMLTSRGLHRAVPIPDLLIAATAERHGVSVLHYDADFDLIAEVTGQLARGVVPRGSAD